MAPSQLPPPASQLLPPHKLSDRRLPLKRRSSASKPMPAPAAPAATAADRGVSVLPARYAGGEGVFIEPCGMRT